MPVVAVCGAGAAGTELSFAFKTRWSQYFGQDIKLTLIGAKDLPAHEMPMQSRKQIVQILKNKKIDFIANSKVAEITPTEVRLESG